MSEKVSSILKFVCIIYLVALIPKIISLYSTFSKQYQDKQLHVLLGVENLVYSKKQYRAIKKLRLGIVSNKASVDQSGTKSVDFLLDNGFKIKKIFALKEDKTALACKIFHVRDDKKACAKVPIVRLHKLSDKALAAHSANLDALLIDIQGTGISSDVTTASLRRLVAFGAFYKKKLIVLDRPNPLGGVIEGPGAVPWRYGLTVGEMAQYFNRDLKPQPADMIVIPLKGWRRGLHLATCGMHDYQQFIFLQPIRYIKPIHVLDTDHGGSHALLFAPSEKLSTWETRYLKRLCWKLGLHCFDCSSMGKNCKKLNGFKLRIKSDINKFSVFNSLITIVRFLNNRKQIKLSFKPKFDEVIGCSGVRQFLQQSIPFDTLKQDIESSLVEFYKKSKICCLYKPFPVIVRPELVKV